MKINTNSLISITEANQNFSRVARLVDETGSVVILKNNVPRYLIIDFQQVEEEREAIDEEHLSKFQPSDSQEQGCLSGVGKMIRLTVEQVRLLHRDLIAGNGMVYLRT